MRFILLLIALVMAIAGDTVLGEITRTGMRQRSVAVDSRSFVEGYIVGLARAELARKPHFGFTQLNVYGIKGGAPLPKPSHVTYDYWRGIYNSLVHSPNEIAEMTSIGGDSVLRMRDGTGAVHRRILAGRDPLQLEVYGDKLEILYFALNVPRPYVLQRVDVYARTGAQLKAEMGREVLRRLQPLFPDLEVTVFIRNDPWFIYETTYPFANPFVEDPGPPNAEAYGRGQTLKCGLLSGSPPCRLQ
jgi:hypothetical protein